jgi:hypothetical protein
MNTTPDSVLQLFFSFLDIKSHLRFSLVSKTAKKTSVKKASWNKLIKTNLEEPHSKFLKKYPLIRLKLNPYPTSHKKFGRSREIQHLPYLNKSLEELSLPNILIDDDMLCILSNLTSLKKLNIYAVNISYLGAPWFFAMKKLEKLTIYGCNMFMLPFICLLKKLRVLKLRDTYNINLRGLKKIKSLQTLHLDLMSITSINIEFVKQIPNLKHLVLEESCRLSSNDVEGLTHLETLKMGIWSHNLHNSVGILRINGVIVTYAKN